MMKYLLTFMAVCLFGLTGLSQDALFSYGTEYGFVLKLTATNNYTWTNDNFYPFKINSLQFNTDVANTTTVVRVRHSKVPQYVGDLVTTSYFGYGAVVTNYDYTITNYATTSITNTFLSVTNAGSTIYSSSDIPQQYIQLGDVITFSFSDNNSKLIFIDATR